MVTGRQSFSLWFLLRLLIGGIFLVSGFAKLLSPYQNFLYVVQAYQILPSAWETIVAHVLPWLELGAGVFLVLGLWTAWALRLAAVLFGIFVCVVGQALLRGLPLESCGCFGELVHVPAQVTIILDSFSLLLVLILLRRLPQATQFSLDKMFL